METYSVRYTRIPTNHNPEQSAVVKANNPEDARTLVRRELGNDRLKHPIYSIALGEEYVPTHIEGEIIAMGR